MNTPQPSASRRRGVSVETPTTDEKTKSSSEITVKKQKVAITTPIEQDVDKALVESLIKPSLYRLTEGLPQHELKLMENEAKECEAALLEEIRILEEAIGVSSAATSKGVESQQPVHHFTTVDAILTSE